MVIITNKRIKKIEEKLDFLSNKVEGNGLKPVQTLEINNFEEKQKYTEEEIKKVAYALNLCTVSVSQIIDYSDLNILEQEYEAILNNINIENIPKDVALLEVFEKILDTVTFFRIQEGNKKFIELEYQHKMKNAIWSAVPNIGLLIAGGNPITMAISLASQIGIGYMNYRKQKANNDIEHKKQLWEMERNAIEQFNALRRELFNTAWRLSEEYNFPDQFRLTEKQIKQYNEILMDTDSVRKYQRLESIKDYFAAYPPYWYYIGNAANSISQEALGIIKEIKKVKTNNDSNEELKKYQHLFDTYKGIAVSYFNKFFFENGDSVSEKNLFFSETNKYALLREDLIAASCAMEYSELLDESNSDDRSIIISLLKIAEKYAPNEFDVLELCALEHLRIGNNIESERMLTNLINQNYNKIVNVQLLSRLEVVNYLDAQNEEAKNLFKNKYELIAYRINNNFIFPWAETESLLQESEGLFLKRQKAILGKKILYVLSELRKRYVIRFNKIIPLPNQNLFYPESYFYDSEESETERYNRINDVLINKKESQRYVDDIGSISYGFEILDVMNQFLKEIKELTKEDDDEYSLFDTYDFEDISNNIKQQISENSNEIQKYTSYFQTARSTVCEEKIFETGYLQGALKMNFSKLSENAFKKIIQIFFDMIETFETIEDVSKADNYFSVWAGNSQIELQEEEFFIVGEKKEDDRPVLTSDVLGGDFVKNEENRKAIEKCKSILKDTTVSTNLKSLDVYYKGGNHFRNYLNKIDKKDKKMLENRIDNIFAILQNKTFAMHGDLLLSLDGVYIKRIDGFHAVTEYNNIKYKDANKTRIAIGEETYSHKNADLEMLLNLFQQFESIIPKQIVNKDFNYYLEDNRFTKLFSSLQNNLVNPLSDSVKLMIANKSQL